MCSEPRFETISRPEKRSSSAGVSSCAGCESDATEFPVELTITRVPVKGAVTFTSYWRDISDRKRAEEMQRFLIEASRVLASTLDANQALTELTRIVVPTLADWCVVDMIDEEHPEGLRRVAVAHADRAKAARVKQMSDRNPIPLDAPSGPGRVARTREAELVPLVTQEALTRGPARRSVARSRRWLLSRTCRCRSKRVTTSSACSHS